MPNGSWKELRRGARPRPGHSMLSSDTLAEGVQAGTLGALLE